ncbi:MAG: hypothetical protein QOK25_2918 [Thermoleophilaceae bacterium]|nr:hypothetical protein [Thermoleophilaceae bacterium]
MRPIRYIPLLLVALAALALPAYAAASPQQVIKDCAADGRVDGHYSDSDLKAALGMIPSDVAEYTDCRSAILAARAAGGGGGGGGATPASTNPALRTPAGAYAGSHTDLAAYRAAARGAGNGRSPALNIGGQTLSPATGGLARLAYTANQLPLPLLVALIAVAALCAAGALTAIWRRWPQLRRAPLRLLRR